MKRTKKGLTVNVCNGAHRVDMTPELASALTVVAVAAADLLDVGPAIVAPKAKRGGLRSNPGGRPTELVGKVSKNVPMAAAMVADIEAAGDGNFAATCRALLTEALAARKRKRR